MKNKFTIMENSILASARATYRLILLLIFLLFSTCVFAQQISVTLSADKTTWTVPCGVSSITVEAWGGGGGGGVRNNKNKGVGPGGGGGAYSRVTIPVKVGDAYTYSIGAGGIAGTDGTSELNNIKVFLDKWKPVKNGKETTFSINGVILTANGGIGALDNTTTNDPYNVGTPAKSVNFGAGGLASTNPLPGAAFVSYSGGKGGKGGNAPGKSGGGGGAGQYGGTGGDPTGSTGGSSTTPGGKGADGVSSNTKGSDGIAFGGGGSGGNKNDSTTRDGGKGGDGGIVVTYTIEPAIQPAASITSDKGNSLSCSVKDVILTANGGTTGFEVSNLWYQGNSCPTYAYINEFSGQLATDYTTVGKLIDGNQTLTATSRDPMIHMEEVLLQKGTVVVSKYKYLTIRYRVTTAPAGDHNFEIYFKKEGQSLSEDKVVRKSINTDGNWHVLNIDMSTHSYNLKNNWNNIDGDITGWRFDYSTVAGTVIDLDYIVLSDMPAIEASSSDRDDSKIKVSPTAETNNYKVIKISELDRCINRSTNCTNIAVERTNNKFKSAIGLWNDKLNWSRGVVPINDDCVIIPSDKNVEINIKDAVAKNVKVEAGGKLTIKKDNSLTVTDAIINESGVDNVIIESDGNLIQINEDANINTGSITAKRDLTLSTGRLQYNYMISPLEDQNLSTIYKSAGFSTASVLYHNETNNKFYNSSGAYIKGRGLAVKEPSSSFSLDTMEAVFRGKPVNGEFTYQLINSNNTNSNRGYNLIGNPYPSNMDLITFYNNNSADGHLSPTFYFWDNKANTQTSQMGDRYGGQAYAQFNATTPPGVGTGSKAAKGDDGAAGSKLPTKYVKVGQGFMAKVIGAPSKTVTFNNSIRKAESAEGFFGKGKQNEISFDRFWLNMISPSNIASNIAVVYFVEGNNAFTRDDSRAMGGSDALYSLVDDEKVSINGKASFTSDDVVKLGTTHFAPGNYSMVLDKREGVFDNGQNIYLKDKRSGIVTNLSDSNYVFQANAGENTDRVEIIFKPETVLVTDSKVKESVVVYRDGNNFIIQSPKIIQRVEVYDSSGKFITALKSNSKQNILDASSMTSGMYVLKITSDDLEVTTRKIVR